MPPPVPMPLSKCSSLIYYRKKKSKKKKERTKNVEVPRQVEEESETTSKPKDKRTPAQISFDRIQEKRVEYITMYGIVWVK